MSDPHNMINNRLLTICAVIATVSSIFGVAYLRPIAKQSSNWNVCYRDSIAWYEKAKPDWSVQDKEVFASNFCNGGIPVRPGPGFQLAPR